MLPTNVRELKRMLKKYGIDVRELPEIRKVTMSAGGYDIVVKDPQVAVLNVGQQTIIQIVCSGLEKVEKEPETKAFPQVSEDDIQFIMDQTGATRDEVIKTLSEEGGDIARAIMRLQEKK
ncbi:MAG: nascent polypeptide-associated complex protein [Sulfolobales archaeon]